jgi:hypothetical protein
MVMRDRRDTQGTDARRVQTPVQTSNLGKPCNREGAATDLLGCQRIRRMLDRGWLGLEP